MAEFVEFMASLCLKSPLWGLELRENLASQLDALRGAIALKTQLELDKSCRLKF